MARKQQPMSMEAMLDEERREVLALIEGKGTNPRPRAGSNMGGARSPSPYTTPRSPVRSMLDYGDDYLSPLPSPYSPVSPRTKTSCPHLAPVRSMLDVDSPVPPTTPTIRSMLDVDSPPPQSGQKQVLSNPSSPIETNFRAHAANRSHRSMSDAAVKPADFGPRSSTPSFDPTAGYQFSNIVTNNSGQAMPKRVTQGGKRPSAASAMAEVMRGNDVSGLVLPGDRGRHYSVGGSSMRIGGGSKSKSKSPHNRFGLRSNSPHLLPGQGRPLSPAGRAMLGDAHNIDINNAYRRLTDTALARSGGSLSELGLRKRSDDAGSGRLAKDYLGPDGEQLPDDSSDDDNQGSSSADESERGRKTARHFDSLSSQNSQKGGSASPNSSRIPQSLLAAAEEERIQVASTQPKYKYRSLLDEPEITVTNPSGERVRHSGNGGRSSSSGGIHPQTSFDNPPPTRSGSRTPLDSDAEEDLTDIKRAQKLSFAMSQVMSTPAAHRTIQIITRGEYAKLVQETQDEHRMPRKYLVATDLSEESTHALEWAIGTVLRDGDTLIAIYCVDEEAGVSGNGIGSGADSSTNLSTAANIGSGGSVPDETKAMREQARVIDVMAQTPAGANVGGIGGVNLNSGAALTALAAGVSGGDALGGGTSGDRRSGSIGSTGLPSPSMRSPAEEERYRAVVDISERVTKLLRKTRLQVRVIVEVIHCKNPKHLITEVIDLVSPTLVILGSRGRSALKGVILGSFSNYLVTKSSVPVMVARKRLRKQGKYKRLPATHQVNNINNPAARSLASAKID